MRWFGNDSVLPFGLLFSLRSNTGRNRGLLAFTIVAIAASVALASGLEISTRAIESALARTADALAGAAEVEVTAGGLGVSEDLLPRVASVPGVAAASPLIEETFRIAEGALEGQALRVLGVDFLSDRKVRGYAISDGTVEINDPLRLLSGLDSMIVTKALADRLGLELGDTLTIESSRGRFPMRVRGLLMPGGVADAYDGQIAAMDVYSLQELTGRRGWFDRIDIVRTPDVDAQALLARVQQEVQGFATAKRAASRTAYVDRAFGTVNLGIWIIASAGIFIAAFLTYGTISLSVDRRAGELALLQSVGLEPRRVRTLVRVDTLVLATVGTVVGIGLGYALSHVLVPSLSALSVDMGQELAAGPAMSWTTLGLALLVGTGIAVVSSLEPAWRASSRPPLELLRAGRRGHVLGERTRIVLLVAAGALLLAAVLPPVDPLARLAAVFGGAIVLMLAAIGADLSGVRRRLLAAARVRLPGVLSLAGDSLLARPLHTALTAAAIAAVVALVSGVSTLLQGIESSFIAWGVNRYSEGVLVTAEDPLSERGEPRLMSPGTIARVLENPEVEAAQQAFGTTIQHQGQEVVLIARTYEVFARYGRLPALSSTSEELVAALINGDVVVSDAFARTFGVAPGDVISLDSPKGAQPVRVAGVIRDYAGPAGSVHMDLGRFDEAWSRPGLFGLLVFPKGTEESLRASLLANAAEDQHLFITRWSEIARSDVAFVDRLVEILSVVTALTGLVGAVAILNLLLGAVAERRRELALLRTAGAVRAQVALLVLADGIAVTGVGAAAGIALGIGSSGVLADILTVSMGWTVDQVIDWSWQLQIAAAALCAAVLAALVPAWSAGDVSPTEMFSPE